jgi:formamidopyrimidine-DNA glycosylase
MPELPEVEALVRWLDSQTKGRRLERLELSSFSALKTVDPPLSALLGRPIHSWGRRGKYLCLRVDGPWLVVHLARSGWVRWHEEVPSSKPLPGRGLVALRAGLSPSNGKSAAPGFDLTEAATEKRLSIWVVDDPDRVPAVAALGADPLSPTFDSDILAGLLGPATGTIKSALTTQPLVAGVGNAYSDEVLHAARISPFKVASRLSHSEVTALYQALVDILGGAVEELSGLGAEALKGEKRSSMRVHGRTGSECPVCGDSICEVSFATRSLQYCPRCQTGGRKLADRRLSRLLK